MGGGPRQRPPHGEGDRPPKGFCGQRLADRRPGQESADGTRRQAAAAVARADPCGHRYRALQVVVCNPYRDIRETAPATPRVTRFPSAADLALNRMVEQGTAEAGLERPIS